MLRPGGLWLNHGPLLYHSDGSAGAVPPRLCADELLLLVERSGFELVETADRACSYSQDPRSMCVSRYNCLFFCVRRREETHATLHAATPTHTHTHPDADLDQPPL